MQKMLYLFANGFAYLHRLWRAQPKLQGSKEMTKRKWIIEYVYDGTVVVLGFANTIATAEELMTHFAIGIAEEKRLTREKAFKLIRYRPIEVEE